MTNNPIELLIHLGVNSTDSAKNINRAIDNLKDIKLVDVILDANKKDSESRTNINNYIKQLTNLEKVKVQLEVDGASTSSNQIKDLENQIKSLKQQLATLNSTSNKGLHSINEDFKNVGKSASDTGRVLDGLGNRNYDKPFVKLQSEAVRTMKSFDDLEEYFRNNQIKFKINENSKGTITRYIAQLKNEFNELSEVVITPKYNKKTGELSSFKTKESLTDTDTFKLNENVQKALGSLDKLYAKGKLTAEGYDGFWKRITNPTATNNAITQIVSEMNSLNTTVGHADKFTKKMDEISTKLKNLSWNEQLATKDLNEFKKSMSNVPLNDLVRADKLLHDINASASKFARSKELVVAGQNQANQFSRLNSELMKTVNLYRKSVDMADVGKVQNMINSFGSTKLNNGADVTRMATQYSVIREEIKKINAEATVATRNSMGVIESFKVAMTKFPVWLGASTIFFSSINSAKEFVRIIVDIDTKLVSIAKVMSEDMDVSTVLDRATQSANEFGQSISQALDAYIEFARQGYKGDDLGNLADAGLIASNVGEISAQQASEYMTASLVQWKKDTSEALGIIDSWNAISNNYATTVEKLAQGQSKAGATARAVGLDFNQLNAIIGTVTASTKQSGSEIGNFVKNSLPRLMSDKGQSTLSGLGVKLTDDAGNLRDVIQIYTEVAEALNGVSDTERILAVEGLAGKYHISRMQALLDDLGSADSMYRSMYETSVNSAGSATRENEVFMQSLQAKINLLRVKVEELALALGEAFLSNGMIAFMEVAGDLLGVFAKIVNTIGGLPVIFALLSVGIMTFSNTARGLVISLVESAVAIYRNKISVDQLTASEVKNTATKRLNISAVTASTTAHTGNALALRATTGAMVGATGATRAFSVSWKAMLATTGVGLAFVGIGVLAEKLMSASAKTKELKDSAISANKLMMDSYKSNREEVDGLIGSYINLEDKINSTDYDLETLDEYYDTQDKIAKLLPSLKIGEDEYGRSLIETSGVIENKIKMLEAQLEVEKQIAEWQSEQDRKKRVDGNLANIEDNEKAIDKLANRLNASLKNINGTHAETGFNKHQLGFDIKSIDDITDALAKVGEARKIAEQDGNDKHIKYYDALITKLREVQGEWNGYTIELQNNQSMLKIDRISDLNKTLKENASLTEKSKNSLENFSNGLLLLADIDVAEGLYESLNSLFLNADSDSLISDIASDFEKLDKATDENFNSIVTSIENSMDTIRETLASNGFSDTEIEVIIDTLNKKLDTHKTKYAEVIEELKRGGGTWEEAEARIKATAGAAGDSAESFGESADAMKEWADELEKITSGIGNINGILEDYQENNKLSASTIVDLVGEYPQLLAYIDDEAQLIKELEKIRDEDIVAAKNQMAEKLSVNEEFYDKNIDALEQFVKQQYSFYDKDLKDFQNLAQAKADVEVQLINELAKKWGVYYDEQLKSFQSIAPEANQYGVYDFGNSLGLPGLEDLDKQFKAQKELNESMKAFDNFTLDRIDLDFNSIGTSAEKSSKETSKATKENIYITDKFKQALEAVNLEIEKQKALQSKFPKHSEAYRKSLEAQLKLEKEKLSLYQSQAKELDKQIKSGKIAQTGSISSDKSSSTNTKINGFSGKQTSGFGYRTHPVTGEKNSFHGGVDLSGSKGSRIDSTTGGKVLSSRNYHSSYGNIVVVQDSNGLKHMYAHLEKVIAKVGDTVTAGQQIGTMGSTGRSTGTHLHYEVRLNDKAIDPSQYIKDAKNGVASVVTSTNASISNTQQSIDDAKSTLNGLQGDVLSQQQAISDLERAIVDSNLAYFDHKRDGYDSIYAYEEAKLKNVEKGTDRYLKTIDKQTSMLEAKQRVNNDELAYLEGLIKKGGLSAITLEEMNGRTMDLKTSIQSLNSEIGKIKLDKIISQYDAYQKKQDNVIDFERAKINELDKNSERYSATLEKVIKHLNRKHITNQEEINDLQKLVDSGQLYGEELENAKDKIQELTISMKDLKQEMADAEFEIIVNIKTRYDEKTDDLQFEIDRSKIIQGMYEENSGDATQEIKKQIGLYEQMAQAHDDSRRKLQAELSQRNLLPEQIKEITELMEDETIAYWNAKSAIQSLTKEMEKANEQALENIANALISAYKEYVQERQDEHMKLIDKEMEKEEERHKKVMDQYKKEMDLFRKNVQEKLDLIDKQEAQRSYDMEMDDLESERKKVSDNINLLSMDDSNEAKSKRKKLQEQLDKIDKDITEKRHDRDITLQKEALNDLLELKEEQVENIETIEDNQYQATIKRIDREREYWQKYYNDLANDERRFAQIREDVMNQNFAKIASDFAGYIGEMQATMPLLADTMDGTMQSVGTAIRQNVIDRLGEAMKMMEDFKALSSTVTNSITDNFNPNASKDTTYSGNTGNTNTSPSTNKPKEESFNLATFTSKTSDQQVMFGKFLNDVLASASNMQGQERQNVKNVAYEWAAQGRNAGSSIPENIGFSQYMKGVSADEKARMKSFFSSNTDTLGAKYSSKIKSLIASLDTGGLVNSSGNGLDGKGGQFGILHPNEVVIDALNTKKLFGSVDILERTAIQLTNFKQLMSNIMKPASLNTQTVGGDTIEINFNGNVINSNQNSHVDFANRIMGDIRRQKGGR